MYFYCFRPLLGLEKLEKVSCLEERGSDTMLNRLDSKNPVQRVSQSAKRISGILACPRCVRHLMVNGYPKHRGDIYIGWRRLGRVTCRDCERHFACCLRVL